MALRSWGVGIGKVISVPDFFRSKTLGKESKQDNKNMQGVHPACSSAFRPQLSCCISHGCPFYLCRAGEMLERRLGA